MFDSEFVRQLTAHRGELLQQQDVLAKKLTAIEVLLGMAGGSSDPAVRPAPPVGDDLGARVLQALNAGPMAGSHVAAAVKESPGVVRACLNRLASKRLVHSTGAGPATKWHLGAKAARSAKPAKEAVPRGHP